MHTLSMIPAMNPTLPIPASIGHTPSAPDSAPTASWHEAAWQQVLARDRSADGSFVYAVRSTAIFCRPSCPSRRPDPSRVTFFRSAAEAVLAGFRACRRCRPDQQIGSADATLVAAAIAHLSRTGAERVDLASLSAAVGHSRAALLRAFRRTLGTTPARYARQQRLESFRRTLAPEREPHSAPARITDAIYNAGFGSSSRLYEQSGATLGMTPSALRAGAPGAEIRYAIADSPLGRTLVAATDRGVCAISFAASDAELLEELRSRFPRARLMPATPVEPAAQGSTSEGPAEWLAAAVRFVLSQLTEHPATAHFPLHVRATAFQQRVWEALRRIPRGETRSYAALAGHLGQPTAARAVASACARNPVALAIPCHRVVGSSGALTGYRWGVDRKRAILAAERRIRQAPSQEPPAPAAGAESGSHPQPSHARRV